METIIQKEILRRIAGIRWYKIEDHRNSQMYRDEVIEQGLYLVPNVYPCKTCGHPYKLGDNCITCGSERPFEES